MSSGNLYIIGTPIGNLADITFRAIEVLKKVNFILCEDTRITIKLLKHYQIKKELVSFNAVSEPKKINKILERLLIGEDCVLVSDSGTPTISDPGVRLINSAREKEINIIGIPGANAAVLALSIAGLPTDSFVFEGFIPQKKGRQKILKELVKENRTIVLYESVYRIEKLLRELVEYMPNREIAVCRELTKIFEEIWRGSPVEILQALHSKTIKGEFTVVISPLGWKKPEK